MESQKSSTQLIPKSPPLTLALILEAIRFDKPTGVYLLVLPCFMGLALTKASIMWYGVFGVGAFLLRSFGCLVNDFFDVKFDAHVARTKNRPQASGRLRRSHAILLMGCFLSVGFLIFLCLPALSKMICLMGLIMAVIYPLMKRWTFFPQAFLGFTFNIGALATCFEIQNIVPHVILYMTLWFWTMAYDTIYAFQDILDDEKIGVKSTAIYFKNHPKIFIYACYALMGLGFLMLGIMMEKSVLYFGGIVAMVGYTFNMIYDWDPKCAGACQDIFKKNVIIGIGYSILLWI